MIYVGRLDARKHLDFNLSRISPEFLTDQNRFLPFLSNAVSLYLITSFLIAVRQGQLSSST